MARPQEIKHRRSEWSKNPESNLYNLTILHHKFNKQINGTECFFEPKFVRCLVLFWTLVNRKTKTLNTEQYTFLITLVKCNCGGTCIFVQDDLYIKEVKYRKDLCSLKEFEMSAVELVDFKRILICIHRFPHSGVYRFLDKLETQIG